MTDEDYKVSIKGPGLTLERNVSKAVGDQVVMLLLTGQKPAKAAVTTADRGRRDAGGRDDTHTEATSIGEYLAQCEAKRMPDRIAAIGLFLRENGHGPNFTTSDLSSNFEAAAESVPKNLSRDVKWAIKAGWIAERAGSKGSYYVTNSGKEAVAKRFSKDVIQKTKGMAAANKKKKAKKSE